MPEPSRSQEELSDLLARAFPDLTETERAALLRASGHVARWTERLPRALPYEDEPAHVFTAPERSP
ncbi:MAG TPA: hypothetical protein VMU06_14325 [Stellaceae bacterium]|nr:hypothetical protein [Stellaceae bacterium]